MDFHLFVESLSLDEVRILSDLLYLQRKKIARATAPPVNHDEAQLIYNGEHIAAIKAYRERLRCDLMTAKAACDVYREELIAANSPSPR